MVNATNTWIWNDYNIKSPKLAKKTHDIVEMNENTPRN